MLNGDGRRKLLGKGHEETRLGRAGQRVRRYDDSGRQYSECEVTSVCGVSGGKQPHLVTKQGGSSALEGRPARAAGTGGNPGGWAMLPLGRGLLLGSIRMPSWRVFAGGAPAGGRGC
jgi:hypothetical protein